MPRSESRPVALVDYDDIEEFRVVLLEDPLPDVSAIESLVGCEVDIFVLRYLTFCDDGPRVSERCKSIVSLIAQDHPVGNVEDSSDDASLIELPDELKRDVRLSRSGGHGYE